MSKEEMIAHLGEMKRDAEALRDRIDAQQRRPQGMVASRVFLVFGVPLLGGIATGVATASILYGVLATVGLFIVIVAVALRFTESPPGPGTRAWEAGMTARLLGDVIAARRGELSAADGERRAYLEREIAYLGAQQREQLAIAASGDRSPGSGSIGFTPYSGG